MYLLVDFCRQSQVLEIIKFILDALHLVFIIVPIILIVFITIDFIKGVISNSEEDVKKIASISFKRMLYCGIIFFVPFLVNFVVNMLGDMGVDYTECITNANSETIAALKAAEQESGFSNSDSPTINNNSSNNSNKKNNQKEKDIKFKITKDNIVIGHYKSKINKYTIVLKGNGKKLNNKDYKFESANPAIASVNSQGVVSAHFGGKTTITVTSKKDKTNQQKVPVLVTHTLYVNVSLKKSVTGVSAKTGKKVRLSAGTKGLYNGIGPNTNYNGYLAGDTLKVNGDYIKVDSNYVKPYKYYVSAIYAKSDVEEFVNNAGFSSKTDYLFWSNSGTGMEYMFKGKKGKWKLYKQFYINVGDAALLMYDSSARTGVHFNYYIGYLDNAVGYNYKIIWKQSSTDNHRTNPWHEYGTGNRYPASHGCTRFQTKDIKYLISIHSKIHYSTLIDF